MASEGGRWSDLYDGGETPSEWSERSMFEDLHEHDRTATTPGVSPLEWDIAEGLERIRSRDLSDPTHRAQADEAARTFEDDDEDALDA